MKLFRFVWILILTLSAILAIGASKVDPLRSAGSTQQAKPNLLIMVGLSQTSLCDLNTIWPDRPDTSATCPPTSGAKDRGCGNTGIGVGEDNVRGDWVEEVTNNFNGTGPGCGNSVVNGTFETGNTMGWVGTATAVNMGATACDGSFMAKFGGALNRNNSLEQVVNVPANCFGLKLQFKFSVVQGAGNNNQKKKDAFYYNINGGASTTIAVGTNNNTCTLVTSVCLDALSKPITIKFYNTNAGTTTTFYLDSVQLFGDGNMCSHTAYRWRWHNPSRVAIMKNILGDSMTIWEADINDPGLAPPVPVDSTWSPVHVAKPAYIPPSFTEISPRRLVKGNYNYINFGLGAFATFSEHTMYGNTTWDLGSPYCGFCNDSNICVDSDADNNGWGDKTGNNTIPMSPQNPLFGGNSKSTILVPIIPDDNPAVQLAQATAINDWMVPIPSRGIATYSLDDPASCAYDEIKLFYSHLTDPLTGPCGRKRYALVITDGDTTGQGCSSNIQGVVNWLLSSGIKTFVVGLSASAVANKATLNEWAFWGGTDAGDDICGFYGISDTCVDTHLLVQEPAHDYAFFVTNAQEFINALQNIIAAIANVDMATGQPVVTATNSGFTGTTDVGILTSSDFPDAYGHIRLFDLRDPLVPVEKWDAGEVLLSRNLSSNPRTIYTYNTTTSSLVPVEDTAASAAALAAISGTTITQDMVKFMLGSIAVNGVDENGQPVVYTKAWRFGDMVNATPAILTAPPYYPFLGGQGHADFAINYKDRHELLIQGGNDLMVHFIDMVDGYEIAAFMPPNLISKIPSLYNNWISGGYKRMGQPLSTPDHIYGIATSVRLSDIKDPNKVSDQGWRSVTIMGEGPGGKAAFALDVTHMYPGRTIAGTTYAADPNYNSSSPFEVLWYKTNTDLQDLGETWSIPVVGYSRDNAGALLFTVTLGSTYGTLNQGKEVYMLRAYDGAIIKKSPTPALSLRVGSKVTDNYFFAPTAGYSDQGISGDSQVLSMYNLDLNGQVWDWNTTSGNPLPDATPVIDVGAGQPLYYAPAIGKAERSSQIYRAISFGSGTYDETDISVNGNPNTFISNLYLGVKGPSAASWTWASKAVNSLAKPSGGNLSDSSRVASPPLMIIPNSGNIIAIFLIYDPTKSSTNCFGESYVISVEFDPVTFNGSFPAGGAITVYDAGAGKASGFNVVGTSVVIGSSGVGGQEATISVVPGITVPPTASEIGVSVVKDFGY